MDQVINVGIAGLGRSGWGIHARLLEPLSDKYRIVAACDLIKERREEIAERFDCLTYEDFDEFVQDKSVELVVVALPSYLHPSATIKALQAGKHVVCEKPMAVKVRDADAMIEAAQKAGKVLTIFQNRRYAPDFVQVRKVIESGVLGRIVMIKIYYNGFGRRWDWQTMRACHGGSLNNTGPHPLDQALQLFGDTEPEVFCHLERTLTLGDADDHVKIILRGPGAPMIDLEISSACAYPQETWNVYGTHGGLSGNAQRLRWRYFDPAELPARQVDMRPTPDRSYNSETLPWKEETWEASQSTEPGQVGFYLDLYETLRHGAPLKITPASVRRQVALLEYCHNVTGL